MIDKNEQKKQVKLLQENLTSIRRIAGWSMQQMADAIGVSKQSISNWEKEGKAATQMTFTQYLAIRSILDYEIRENKNEVLGQVVTILLDSGNELNDDTYKEIQTKIAEVAKAASVGSLTGAALTLQYLNTMGTTLTSLKALGMASPVLSAAGSALLGPLGLVGGAVALVGGAYLSKFFKKKK